MSVPLIAAKMVILDTSVWIEFFKTNPGIYPTVKTLLENRMILGLEWLFAEFLQGAKNTHETTIIMGYWNNIPTFDAPGIWLEAGRYASANRLLSKEVGLIDAAILSAALKSGPSIWSLNRKPAAVRPEHLRYQSPV